MALFTLTSAHREMSKTRQHFLSWISGMQICCCLEECWMAKGSTMVSASVRFICSFMQIGILRIHNKLQRRHSAVLVSGILFAEARRAHWSGESWKKPTPLNRECASWTDLVLCGDHAEMVHLPATCWASLPQASI